VTRLQEGINFWQVFKSSGLRSLNFRQVTAITYLSSLMFFCIFQLAFSRVPKYLLLRCRGLQLSTLGQPRVFPPSSSVLSLMCCLCEWESHHLAIVRNVISPALPRSSSVSVSVNTTIQGSVWPSGRLYMAEVYIRRRLRILSTMSC